MSASFKSHEDGVPLRMGASGPTNRAVESHKSYLETPRTVLSPTSFDRSSNKSNLLHDSPHALEAQYIGQEMPDTNAKRSETKLLAQPAEFNSLFDKDLENENFVPSYTLAAPKQEEYDTYSFLPHKQSDLGATRHNQSQVKKIASVDNNALDNELTQLVSQDQLSTSSAELRDRLKIESCMGIGSWSKYYFSSTHDTIQNVDAILPDVCAMFDRNWLADITECPNGTRGQRPSRSTASHTRIVAKPTISTTDADVGKHGSQENGTDEEDSDDDIPGGRRRGVASTDLEMLGPRLACPFHKNDPQFFRANVLNGTTFRSCAGPGFSDVARVKAHLYRKHKASESCPVCGLHFKAQDKLIEHVRARSCELQPIMSPKSITAEIEKVLKNKKKSSLSPAEGWNEIYLLIFPGSREIPSPYYDSVDAISPSSTEFYVIEDLETFLIRELPSALRETIDIAFQGQLPLSIDERKTLLATRLGECWKQVLLRYHTSQRSSVSSTGGSALPEMSTPKAPYNGFEPTSIVSNQTYDALSLPWQQISDTPTTAYQQLQYRQRDSMDLTISRARDSGYGTSSIGCFSNCTGFCSCYDSDMNHNSYEGGTQAPDFTNALGLSQGHQQSTLDPESMQSSILTSIPRMNNNLDHLDYLELL